MMWYVFGFPYGLIPPHLRWVSKVIGNFLFYALRLIDALSGTLYLVEHGNIYTYLLGELFPIFKLSCLVLHLRCIVCRKAPDDPPMPPKDYPSLQYAIYAYLAVQFGICCMDSVNPRSQLNSDWMIVVAAALYMGHVARNIPWKNPQRKRNPSDYCYAYFIGGRVLYLVGLALLNPVLVPFGAVYTYYAL